MFEIYLLIGVAFVASYLWEVRKLFNGEDTTSDAYRVVHDFIFFCREVGGLSNAAVATLLTIIVALASSICLFLWPLILCSQLRRKE